MKRKGRRIEDGGILKRNEGTEWRKIEGMKVEDLNYATEEMKFSITKPALWISLKGTDFQETVFMPKGLEYRDGKFYVTDEKAYRRSIRNPYSQWRQFIEEHGLPWIGKKIKVDKWRRVSLKEEGV